MNHLDIIIHVSNFHDKNAGGIWEKIQLGNKYFLRASREKSLSMDLFLTGSLFIMGLYHFGVFILRRKDISSFYFGIFCSLFSLRTLLAGEKYFVHLFPTVSFSWLLTLDFLAFCLGVPTFLSYVSKIFPEEDRAVYRKSLIVSSIMVSLIIFFSPVYFFTGMLLYIQIIILLSCIYIIFVMITAIKLKRIGAKSFASGFVIFSVFIINDILHANHLIHTGFYTPFGFIFFIFSQSFFLSMRFSLAFYKVEDLSIKLEAYIKKLEFQKEEYRTLFNNLNIGVYRNTGGEKDSFLKVNPAAASMFGYDSIEEFMRIKIDDLFVDIKDKRKIGKRIIRIGEVKNLHIKFQKKNGECIWTSLSARIKKDENNKFQWIDGIIEDITEQENAKRELEKMTVEIIKINSAYEKFVPQQLIQLLKKEDVTKLELGDNIAGKMSVLFSDIRSFTRLSENMTPEENFNFINSYLKRMGPIIRQKNGFIDKYIGDAIMALFPEKANHAIDASIDMLKELTRYNRHRKNKGYPPVNIGIGIHTGDLIMGIIGEANRMEGTVISDSVNLASRLEGLTKIYGSSIIISEDSLKQLIKPELYNLRKIGNVVVRGKTKPIGIIEVLDGMEEERIKGKIKSKNVFEKGVKLYFNSKIIESKHYFMQAIQQDPLDKAAQIYLNRVNYFEEHGILPDWNHA